MGILSKGEIQVLELRIQKLTGYCSNIVFRQLFQCQLISLTAPQLEPVSLKLMYEFRTTLDDT